MCMVKAPKPLPPPAPPAPPPPISQMAPDLAAETEEGGEQAKIRRKLKGRDSLRIDLGSTGGGSGLNIPS
jgi:hypothetical protein